MLFALLTWLYKQWGYRKTHLVAVPGRIKHYSVAYFDRITAFKCSLRMLTEGEAQLSHQRRDTCQSTWPQGKPAVSYVHLAVLRLRQQTYRYLYWLGPKFYVIGFQEQRHAAGPNAGSEDAVSGAICYCLRSPDMYLPEAHGVQCYSRWR